MKNTAIKFTKTGPTTLHGVPQRSTYGVGAAGSGEWLTALATWAEQFLSKDIEVEETIIVYNQGSGFLPSVVRHAFERNYSGVVVNQNLPK